MSTWPPHVNETVPWRQAQRAGTREDRMLSEIDVTIPPLIATLDYTPALPLVRECEAALVAVAVSDTAAEGHSPALARFMLRSESVASSKIERISASAEDFARALAGSSRNTSATSILAASTALHALVSDAGESGRVALDDLLVAHYALMKDDPEETRYAGRVRDVQNWVGGSDYSPRRALHVPPTPSRIPELLDDLLAFVNRDDVPVIAQAAIAHAQFESIHPFTDGNGRIGRALISAVLRRRRLTNNTVIPLASGILARRGDYFASLTRYRAGDPAQIVALIAESARVAAVEARVSIDRIRNLPDEWRAEVTSRHGSAVAALIPAFYEQPVMTAADIERSSGAGTAQAYKAIERLTAAGIVREITGRKRDRMWAAVDLMAELDDLDSRIQAGMRPRP